MKHQISGNKSGSNWFPQIDQMLGLSVLQALIPKIRQRVMNEEFANDLWKSKRYWDLCKIYFKNGTWHAWDTWHVRDIWDTITRDTWEYR